MDDDLAEVLKKLGGYADKVPPSKPRKTTPEKGVPWAAKVIDGEYYVPLRQVSELLAVNAALPAVRKGIDARVRAQADRKQMGL